MNEHDSEKLLTYHNQLVQDYGEERGQWLFKKTAIGVEEFDLDKLKHIAKKLHVFNLMLNDKITHQQADDMLKETA